MICRDCAPVAILRRPGHRVARPKILNSRNYDQSSQGPSYAPTASRVTRGLSMSIQPHASSYYAASAHPSPVRPALAGAVDCDVCVVGGGIAGCSAALHLAERGYKVVLLEENRIGWGASGRSGAQAIYGLAAPQSKIKRLVGPADARVIWDVTVEALDLIRELVAKHRIDCDWTQGHMLTAIKPRHDADIHAELEELRDQYQYRSVRYMPRDEVRSVLASERYLGALYDSQSGHLHPLNYTLGLAAAAERAGAQVFEGTRALSFTNTPSGATLRTPAGEVRARFVVLSGNVYLGDTAPALKSKIMAVATYIVATEPLGAERARGVDQEQRRRQRHELGVGLLPAVGGPPAAVWRPGQLFGAVVIRRTQCHAQAHARRIPTVGMTSRSTSPGAEMWTSP